MLRTAQLLPPPWLLTLGFDPTRFQTEPPACYRAPWQPPGPDSHRQATTSFPSGARRSTSRPDRPPGAHLLRRVRKVSADAAEVPGGGGELASAHVDCRL